ncbi:DNA-binding CsgD family transcriptional regulator [Conyzicola lurida]|uniref:DNA-binding CsgD family transcriptional regulator n=1 Tax=Conyzicola lurida TaxID=1172621 RepID=A0A841AP27_9MICO|nr:LuxR family transcriptional regulator [Conyzicola lurida]MBB5843501.1 DNA-binding CsgD family transcriptional regulator [Conyzicola lurida]
MTKIDSNLAALDRTTAAALIAALPASTDQRLLLVGEPGIGKSTLIAAAATRFSLSGSLVLRASPSFAERHTSYSMLWDLLGDLDLELLGSTAGEHRTILEIALGRRPAETEIPALATALSFESILRQISANMPVVLLVDDLHWSDPESIAVMERALRHLSDSPIRLVATTREYGRRSAHTSGLTFDPNQVHDLDGLTVDELERLTRPAWPSTPTRSQVVALREHTGGNPMWAFELIRRGATGDLGALQVGTLDAPPPLAVAVADRLQALSRPASDVVAIVALLGRPSLALLGDVLRFSGIPENAIDEADDAGFLEMTTGTATTRHPLHASAATASLGQSRRRELHAFIARAITDPVIKAQHLQQSQPPGPDETIALALTAAAVIMRQRGARLRSAHFDAQAVERTDPSTAAYQDRLLTQAQHLFSAGDDNACLLALGRVAPSRLDIPQYDTWVALTTSADPARARGFLATAAAPEAVRKAILHANSVSAAGLRVSQRARRSAAALSDLSAADTPNATHRALRGLARSHVDAGDGLDHEIIADMNRRQAVRLVVGLDDSGLATEGFLAHLADDVHLSRRSLAGLVDWARAEGKEGIERVFLAHAALVETIAGNVGAAEVLASRSGFDITSGDLPAGLQTMAGLLMVATGRHDDLRRIIPAWRASTTDTALEIEGLLGMSALGRRDWHEAIRHLRVAAKTADDLELVEPGSRFRVDLPLVEALLQVGDIEEAGVRLARIRAFVETRDRPISQIGLHRMTALYLAATGDLSAALAESTAAVDLAADHRRPGDEMLALLQRTRILRRLRRVTQARDDISGAELLFEAAGIEGLRHHLEAASTEKRKVVSPAQLTAAERRVDGLVRDGQSNGEIAAALFVSVRTVESHVSAILRKTGSASRAKLIARD